MSSQKKFQRYRPKIEVQGFSLLHFLQGKSDIEVPFFLVWKWALLAKESIFLWKFMPLQTNLLLTLFLDDPVYRDQHYQDSLLSSLSLQSLSLSSMTTRRHLCHFRRSHHNHITTTCWGSSKKQYHIIIIQWLSLL